jgi:hypothetical protein
MFQYYVFGDGETARAHIPPARHGVLGSLDADSIRKRRVQIGEKLKS